MVKKKGIIGENNLFNMFEQRGFSIALPKKRRKEGMFVS